MIASGGASHTLDQDRWAALAASLKAAFTCMHRHDWLHDEILVVVAKGEDSALHDFCCKVSTKMTPTIGSLQT